MNTTTTTTTLEEQEQAAYMNGDRTTAALLGRILELEAQVLELENKIDDTATLEGWEARNGSAYEYVQFFQECFERLGAHYPAPSISSDFDKSVIFGAIEAGEDAVLERWQDERAIATDETRSNGPRG